MISFSWARPPAVSFHFIIIMNLLFLFIVMDNTQLYNCTISTTQFTLSTHNKYMSFNM